MCHVVSCVPVGHGFNEDRSVLLKHNLAGSLGDIVHSPHIIAIHSHHHHTISQPPPGSSLSSTMAAEHPTYGLGWTFVASIPLSKLMYFMVGLHPQSGLHFCAPWRTTGLQTPGAQHLSKENPKRVGPFAHGNIDYFWIDLNCANKVAIYEIFNCAGTASCEVVSRKCAKQWRYAIHGSDPHLVHIFERGCHNSHEEFQPDLNKMKLPPFLVKLICDMDGLSNGGFGGQTSLTAIQNHLEQLAFEFGDDGSQLVFLHKKVPTSHLHSSPSTVLN